MHTAGRQANLKIVCVSLVAAVSNINIGIAASPKALDMGAKLEARTHMLKAGQRVIWSVSETSTSR